MVDAFGFTAPYEGADLANNPLSMDIQRCIEDGKTIQWTHNYFSRRVV